MVSKRSDDFQIADGQMPEDSAYLMSEGEHYRLDVLSRSMESMAIMAEKLPKDVNAAVTASLFRLASLTLDDMTSHAPFAIRKAVGTAPRRHH